jgi:hypothetical protein
MDETHFIESIFNYCNRRCEHCAFTERCRLFSDLRDYDHRHPDRSPSEQTRDKFQECFRLLEQWCEREGIDFEGLQRDAHSEEADARMDRGERAVRSDPLQKLATAYTHATLRLIDGLSAARALRAWPSEVDAAVETIGWYAGMVGAKVYRALHGFAERDELPEEDVVQNDWNGSAKLARLIVSESKEAWGIVLKVGEAPADSPLTELVGLLDRIDAGLAERFPRAMEFLRPGFDEASLMPQRGGRIELRRAPGRQIIGE